MGHFWPVRHLQNEESCMHPFKSESNFIFGLSIQGTYIIHYTVPYSTYIQIQNSILNKKYIFIIKKNYDLSIALNLH